MACKLRSSPTSIMILVSLVALSRCVATRGSAACNCDEWGVTRRDSPLEPQQCRRCHDALTALFVESVMSVIHLRGLFSAILLPGCLEAGSPGLGLIAFDSVPCVDCGAKRETETRQFVGVCVTL